MAKWARRGRRRRRAASRLFYLQFEPGTAPETPATHTDPVEPEPDVVEAETPVQADEDEPEEGPGD